MMVNEETDIRCYRLRTARQRKRMARKGFEKKLRALDRERTELWRKKNNLGWIELKPPVMRGWKRFFVLRQDVAESQYAAFYQNILDKINTTVISNRKDFKIKKKRVRKWKYEEKKQQLKEPNLKAFTKMNFSEREQEFFQDKYVMDCYNQWVKVFEFKEPWRFVLKVRPNMIYKTRVRDEVIEKRSAELYNYFDRNHLRPRVAKLKGESYRYSWYREKYFDPRETYEFKNVPLPQILDSIKEY